jgi:hypothetical protein
MHLRAPPPALARALCERTSNEREGDGVTVAVPDPSLSMRVAGDDVLTGVRVGLAPNDTAAVAERLAVPAEWIAARLVVAVAENGGEATELRLRLALNDGEGEVVLKHTPGRHQEEHSLGEKPGPQDMQSKKVNGHDGRRGTGRMRGSARLRARVRKWRRPPHHTRPGSRAPVRSEGLTSRIDPSRSSSAPPRRQCRRC